jgi:hypothetical protein
VRSNPALGALASRLVGEFLAQTKTQPASKMLALPGRSAPNRRFDPARPAALDLLESFS